MISFKNSDELFASLLGLKNPWAIVDIEVDYNKMRIDLEVEYCSEQLVECPKCKCMCKIYDHREERKWRHMDTMQFKTYIKASVPRVDCPKDGVVTIGVPWAEPNARYTFFLKNLP